MNLNKHIRVHHITFGPRAPRLWQILATYYLLEEQIKRSQSYSSVIPLFFLVPLLLAINFTSYDFVLSKIIKP